VESLGISRVGILKVPMSWLQFQRYYQLWATFRFGNRRLGFGKTFLCHRDALRGGVGVHWDGITAYRSSRIELERAAEYHSRPASACAVIKIL
jgi:hypothetical protein